MCSQVRHNGEIVPLDDIMLRKIKRVTDTLNRQGLRVVAVATKYLPAREGDYQRADESDLILEGYIAFLDPPKETTAPALKALKASGITVKILTGDSELVAAKVCHEVGWTRERWSLVVILKCYLTTNWQILHSAPRCLPA